MADRIPSIGRHFIALAAVCATAAFAWTGGDVALSGEAGDPDVTEVTRTDGGRGTVLSAQGGPADDEIVIESIGEEGYAIVSSQGVRAADASTEQQCTQKTPTRLECKAPFFGELSVRGGAGADVLESRISGDPFFFAGLALIGQAGRDTLLSGPSGDFVTGGLGRDIATGGPGGDSLRGGRGRDIARGGPGGDSLGFSEPGRDRFSAGKGDDVIGAQGGGKDRLIDCGGGDDDEARRDRSDAKAVDCETVIRSSDNRP